MATTEIQPSDALSALISSASLQPGMSAMLAAVSERQSDFRNPIEATLTGIGLDPSTRAYADTLLDRYWSDATRRTAILNSSNNNREIVVGSGFHAATYAATRVLAGFPRPIVLERSARVGGTFALTAWPTFNLNSRNRAGGAGLAGDQGASLNYLPGAPVQAANLGMAEYQTNADMGFVIRLALAQYADVVTDANVQSVSRGDGREVEVDVAGYGLLTAGRLIDARGLGDPVDADQANGSTVLTFPDFLRRMAGPWPLRGVRRAAVIGGGDSGKCAVESFLGLAPQPLMAAVALDNVDRVDWYADNVPGTCDAWRESVRGRYQAIGRYLRPDRFGVKRLNVINRRTRPVALPDGALVDGRSYDLVVICTGNTESRVEGLQFDNFDTFSGPADYPIARRHYNFEAYRVGPHARLPFTSRERQDGIADIDANAVSMFRTASKTATLAATLPGPVVA